MNDKIPAGLSIKTLTTHNDERGYLYEFYRECWVSNDASPMIQWNYAASKANVLRGINLHKVHTDYFLLIDGIMLLGLCDVRKGSPTEGLSSIAKLIATEPKAILIPPGITHGFYFPEGGKFLIGRTKYFNPSDDFRCHWNDPLLNIPWPSLNPILSKLDRDAPSFSTLMNEVGEFLYQEEKECILL